MQVGYRQKSRFSTNIWLSKIAVGDRTVGLFVCDCSMNQYAEEKRTENNLIERIKDCA